MTDLRKHTIIQTNELFLDTFFVMSIMFPGLGLRDNRSSGRVGSGGGTSSSYMLLSLGYPLPREQCRREQWHCEQNMETIILYVIQERIIDIVWYIMWGLIVNSPIFHYR